MDLDLYSVVGEDGFARLVAGFYGRVRTDDLLAPLYPEDDWEGAEQRLRDFLVGRCGGPSRYVEARGHPRLRMRHARFRIDEAVRDRWVAHMEASLAEAGLDPQASNTLRRFLGEVATFLRNA